LGLQFEMQCVSIARKDTAREPIAHKYSEGRMQSTLQRGLKVPEASAGTAVSGTVETTPCVLVGCDVVLVSTADCESKAYYADPPNIWCCGANQS